MVGILSQIDLTLRTATPLAGDRSRTAFKRTVVMGILLGVFYGILMGCYGGISSGRILQPIYSGLKVPMLLGITFLLSLPSFYVINTLMGLADDFKDILRALAAAQAVLTIVLASLSPFTLFWYASFTDHDVATLFNAFMFSIASLCGQRALRRYYKPLIARNSRHRWMRRIWLLIYAFVGIQMGWVLRPFIGHPDMPTTFFRAESWSNAYVHVGQIIWRALSGAT